MPDCPDDDQLRGNNQASVRLRVTYQQADHRGDGNLLPNNDLFHRTVWSAFQRPVAHHVRSNVSSKTAGKSDQ